MELTVTKAIKVKLPLYMKHKDIEGIYVFFKNETNPSLAVYNFSINTSNLIKDYDLTDYIESTETEFKKAFNKTSKYLKSLI